MSHRSRVLAALLAVLGLAAPAAAGLFAVQVETGQRRTALGDTVAYDLYYPAGSSEPRPAVVLDHGFARSKRFHATNARYLAARGLVVLVPNLVSLLGGESAQLRNVANTRDHVEWLRRRASTPGDVLYERVKPELVGLAGHSAGGAISLEAAADPSLAIQALLLLDAVPWSRTLGVAEHLEVPHFASLRSEPSSCNAQGGVRDLLARLPFSSDDVRIVRASHCDPENPTDLGCSLFCGGTRASQRSSYQRLLYLFFQDALKLESVESPPDTYGAAILRGVSAGTLVVTRVNPASR